MLEKLFPKEYFKERRLLLLAGTLIPVMLVIVLRVLVEVRQYDYKVTVRYTQYGADSFVLGEWYTLYEPAFFALITTLTSLLLSLRLYKLDVKLSYLVLVLQYIILLFLFIVSGALLGASSIVS